MTTFQPWMLATGLIALLVLLITHGNPAPAQASLRAQASLVAGTPGLISYQGYLEDDAGEAVNGTVSMRFAIYTEPIGGSALWQESQSVVSVGAGFFTTMLGMVTPLAASVFDGPSRYLEVTVNLGAGDVVLPRQQLTAVPYALQAEHAGQAQHASQAENAVQAEHAVQAQSAQVAASVPWSGITDVPSDLGGTNYANVIVVAASGGNFTSVAAALNSLSNPSPTNRFLVWVAPGVYAETELVQVRPYVHLRGAGPNVSVITSARTGAAPGNAAATAQLDDNGRISDLTIRNTGIGNFGLGIWSSGASRAATLDNLVVEASGAGGVGHYAVYLNDSEPTIRHSRLHAYGAVGFGTAVNAALGSVNVSGGFPQPLIESSILLGGSSTTDEQSCSGNTGTGFGIQYTNTAATVRDSLVCGDRRAIFGGTNGITRIEHTELWVSSTGGSFLIETTGSATLTLANSGVFYVGNKFTGTGGLTCVHSYLAHYSAASNGTTPATACN